ncbi:MAG: hypothetical protein EXS06_04985 [Planctomycetaceae bacterium]|nr:hypothetical protein [Planctomycetaceae bacterium]
MTRLLIPAFTEEELLYLPDPEPPRSTRPFGAELLLPLLDEPVPDPELPKSTGPFGADRLPPEPPPTCDGSVGPLVFTLPAAADDDVPAPDPAL